MAAGLKWAPLALLPLELLERRRGAIRIGAWFAVAAVAICAGAFALFGTAWLGALLPFAHRRAVYAVPTRPAEAGLPAWLALLPLLAATPWLVRSPRRGRPRRALATVLLLCASPWVLPWYAVWVVPLAAIEHDVAAWIVALALSAYLLPEGVPLSRFHTASCRKRAGTRAAVRSPPRPPVSVGAIDREEIVYAPTP